MNPKIYWLGDNGGKGFFFFFPIKKAKVVSLLCREYIYIAPLTNLNCVDYFISILIYKTFFFFPNSHFILNILNKVDCYKFHLVSLTNF